MAAMVWTRQLQKNNQISSLPLSPGVWSIQCTATLYMPELPLQLPMIWCICGNRASRTRTEFIQHQAYYFFLAHNNFRKIITMPHATLPQLLFVMDWYCPIEYAHGLVVLCSCCRYIDGLLQERRNSSALAMELRLSFTKPSILQLL